MLINTDLCVNFLEELELDLVGLLLGAADALEGHLGLLDLDRGVLAVLHADGEEDEVGALRPFHLRRERPKTPEETKEVKN